MFLKEDDSENLSDICLVSVRPLKGISCYFYPGVAVTEGQHRERKSYILGLSEKIPASKRLIQTLFFSSTYLEQNLVMKPSNESSENVVFSFLKIEC